MSLANVDTETEQIAASLRAAQPSRPVGQCFETLALAYYAEMDEMGRKPKRKISNLGKALGIEDQEVTRIMRRARAVIDRNRRVRVGGKRIMVAGLHSRIYRYVVEDETGSNFIREA